MFFLIALSSSGCRIRSRAPYWIETHGTALGSRVVGWSYGALLLGGDRHLWGYPGPWANPWVAKEQSRSLRAITAARANVYGLFADGQVARFNGGSWSPLPGSANWGASELGVSEDDHLLVISGGKLRAFAHDELRPLSCDAVPNLAAVAATHDDEAFVLDQAGALYYGGASSCDPVQAPVPLTRIAARGARLLALARDGSVWRRRDNVWQQLPPAFKVRAGQGPEPMTAQDVGVSAYSTWLVDTQGSVFILSDES